MSRRPRIFTWRRRKPKTIGQILMLTFVVFTVALVLTVWLINEGIEPTIMDIAERRINQVAREAINEAVSKRLVDDLQGDDLLLVETNEDGEIVSVGFNSVVINRVLRNTTFRVQNYLKRIERGEISPEDSIDFDINNEVIIDEDTISEDRAIVRIPIGQATNNALLANLGPQVPVFFTMVGDVQSTVNRNITEYGINNAMIDISVTIEATVQIVIPFSTSTTVVTTDIPIYVGTLPGKVPNFYSSGGGNSSLDIAVPMEDFIEDE